MKKRRKKYNMGDNVVGELSPYTAPQTQARVGFGPAAPFVKAAQGVQYGAQQFDQAATAETLRLQQQQQQQNLAQAALAAQNQQLATNISGGGLQPLMGFENGDEVATTVTLPEVPISALSSDSEKLLSQSQRALYDMYRAPDGGIRQTLPIKIGGENRQVGDIHWKDALRMAQNAPRTQIYDTPHMIPSWKKDKYQISGDRFRAHANLASGDIYVPPVHSYYGSKWRDLDYKDEYGSTRPDYTNRLKQEFYIDPRTNKPWGGVELPEGFIESIGTPNFTREGITPAMYMDMYKERGPYYENVFQHTPDVIDRQQQGDRMSEMIAEYAHTSPEVTNPRSGFIGNLQTLFDRSKRFIDEKEWPDASNYQSPEDLEYHTHTSPNSAENQLYDLYNFGRYNLMKPIQNKEDGDEVKYDLSKTKPKESDLTAEEQLRLDDYFGMLNMDAAQRYLDKSKVSSEILPDGTINPDMPAGAELSMSPIDLAVGGAFTLGPKLFSRLGALDLLVNPFISFKNIAKEAPISKSTKHIFEEDYIPYDQFKKLRADARSTEGKSGYQANINLTGKQLEQVGKGGKTVDDVRLQYIQDLQTKEGFDRLMKQEREYLTSLQEKYPGILDAYEGNLDYMSKVMAKARIEELMGMTNRNFLINQNVLKGESTQGLQFNPFQKDLFGNASFLNYADKARLTRHNDFLVNPKYDPSVASKFPGDNPRIVPIGKYPIPGDIQLGSAFVSSKPAASHEIGHFLQRGRQLPIDDYLRTTIEPKPNLTASEKKAYDYFMTGSEGKEPSAFLHELRQAMLDAKLIKNKYDPVTIDDMYKASAYFQKNPSGTLVKRGKGKYLPSELLSHTRIFDFMENTKTNQAFLAAALNKLPAVTGIALGIGALSEQGEGDNNSYQDGDNVRKKLPSAKDLDYDKLYEAIMMAEHANYLGQNLEGKLYNPWIRTRTAPPKGSTAYGPVQIGSGLLKTYLDPYHAKPAGMTPEDIEIIQKLRKQGLLFSDHGKNKGKTMKDGKPYVYDPLFDYGATGDFADSPQDHENRAGYKTVAKKMLTDMVNRRNDGDVYGALQSWRGTTSSDLLKDYIGKIEDYYYNPIEYDTPYSSTDPILRGMPPMVNQFDSQIKEIRKSLNIK